ncbi:hypothetical protein LR48_Vigan231s001700 [Vigna angularis]|uniref:Uncharacterized protein n=1 Tax=Phaseolus angularis TaxID=3914 RepID=A0A0L9T6A1_PHAAN|nr:hypothetical protein LR48_Vigan231s001700 [Vigna angularis]
MSWKKQRRMQHYTAFQQSVLGPKQLLHVQPPCIQRSSSSSLRRYTMHTDHPATQQ